MIRLIAARWHLKQVLGEEIAPLATQLLAAGYDSQAMRELAGEHATLVRDHGALFSRALTEAGAPILTDQEAIVALAVAAARAILAGADPYRSIDGLAGLWSRYSYDEPLLTFYSLADSWEDDETHRPEIEKEIRLYATELLATYGSVAS